MERPSAHITKDGIDIYLPNGLNWANVKLIVDGKQVDFIPVTIDASFATVATWPTPLTDALNKQNG